MTTMTDDPVTPSATVQDHPRGPQREPHARATLVACFLGMFVVTLDAVVVNVALPPIRAQLGGGISGLQWVVDGYTLTFAAFLLSAGAFSDRVGARRAYVVGVGAFVVASVVCAMAPDMGTLVAARLVQGVGAAAVMPASMSLLGQAYPDPVEKARAVGVWAMGGAVASSSGPLLGGLLTQLSWRLIFLVNVPAGVVILLLLARTRPSVRRAAKVDPAGQLLAVVGMSGLTFAAIEAGARGRGDPAVLVAGAIALAAMPLFVLSQVRGRHPMVPPALFASPTVTVVVAVGAAFMVGFYGLPFVMSLDLQQHRGLTTLATGLVFLPMMLAGALLTPLSARITVRLGSARIIVLGLLLMTAGLVGLALLPQEAPLWQVAALMTAVGVGGPTVMPPAIAAMLNAVDPALAGTASGVLNTSRQVGGALAVAVFGTVLAGGFGTGVPVCLMVAAAVALAAALLATVAHSRLGALR